MNFMCFASSLQEGELELEAELAKADKASHSETLRDTAPVIDANKVMSLNVQSAVRRFS